MSIQYVGRNVDEIARLLSKDLKRIGTEVQVGRVGKILELRNVVYDIREPSEEWLSYPSLNQSKIWATSEIMTEFLGLNPPLTEFYTSDLQVQQFMKTFHRGDGRHNYTYGIRWNNNQAFQKILKRLEADRYSRQAVMNIYDSSIDLSSDEQNIPCTISHQFMIRKDPISNNDTMHLFVHMRSNDFFRGWKYDSVLNSFILRAFAGFLGCEVGILTFFVGSLHIYEADISKLDTFLKDEWITPSQYLGDPPQTVPIPFRLSFEELYIQLWKVRELEEKSRYTEYVYADEVKQLHPYFQDWAMRYIQFNDKYRR